MVNKEIIIQKLTELKPALYKDYAVKEIGIFGSYSDETFTKDSDIDIIVELEKPIGWKFFSLELYLGNIFNRKIDLVSTNSLKNQLKSSILKQAYFV